MPLRGNCPATAFTIVRNSAVHIERCLQTALFCQEHLLLDGGSTDGTLDIAAQYGCRVERQDARFLDANGRIKDWAGITNQGNRLATYPWIFLFDSDETIDDALIRDIQNKVTTSPPGLFQVERQYILDGKIIRYASTYPNRHYRLYHREAFSEFVKPVHEKPLIKPGFPTGILQGVQYVPLDGAQEQRRKALGYAAIEIQAINPIGWLTWFRVALSKLLRIILRFFRIVLIRLFHPKGAVLPWRYEVINILYPWTIVVGTCPLARR